MLLFRSSSLEVSSLSDSFRFCCWKTSPLHNLSGMKRVFKHIINLSEKIVSSSTLLPFFTSINLMQINQEMRNFLGFIFFPTFHIVWKLLKMSHLNFWILAFSTNFCPIKTDLPGNTVWQQASGFQKLAKMDHFWHF